MKAKWVQFSDIFRNFKILIVLRKAKKIRGKQLAHLKVLFNLSTYTLTVFTKLDCFYVIRLKNFIFKTHLIF